MTKIHSMSAPCVVQSVKRKEGVSPARCAWISRRRWSVLCGLKLNSRHAQQRLCLRFIRTSKTLVWVNKLPSKPTASHFPSHSEVARHVTRSVSHSFSRHLFASHSLETHFKILDPWRGEFELLLENIRRPVHPAHDMKRSHKDECEEKEHTPETKATFDIPLRKKRSREEGKIRQNETSKDARTQTCSVPRLREAPVFRPSANEFRDPMRYIRSITSECWGYGIVKIIPPAGWDPPSPFTRIDLKRNVPTYKQRVDRLNCMSDNKITDGNYYTPSTYRAMALEFGRKWRERHPEHTKTVDVEGMFWSVVKQGHPKIEVEYGANLSPTELGSGFETEGKCDDRALGTFAQWNLNTIGYCPDGSLLGLECAGNISGITMPWIYLGMLFASFAWHVEDNHLFSINYLHQGAPKSWYGCGTTDADKFDEVLESKFGKSKSLLRKLNFFEPPETFLSNGVPITHALQEPGQFIITWPRSYHAGFSHGFNIGEAVNFATLEWIPNGIKCRELYHDSVKCEYRHSVFNVDSLFAKIAKELVQRDLIYWRQNCTTAIVQNLHGILKRLADEDRQARVELRSRGVSEMAMDDKVEDEELRECKICKRSAFTAVLICSCQSDKTVCLKHHNCLCDQCPPAGKMILSWVRPVALDKLISLFAEKAMKVFPDFRVRSSSPVRSA